MQILVVEDDQALAEGLCTALRRQNYAVNSVSSGRDALHVIRAETPDIAILDLGLPDMDGIDVLKQARSQHPALQILILTARSHIEQKIIGLDSGADDYLAKPFEIPELLARLRVLERRLGTAKATQIIVGEVKLDTSNNSVVLGDNELELSRREFMLLRSLTG